MSYAKGIKIGIGGDGLFEELSEVPQKEAIANESIPMVEKGYKLETGLSPS